MHHVKVTPEQYDKILEFINQFPAEDIQIQPSEGFTSTIHQRSQMANHLHRPLPFCKSCERRGLLIARWSPVRRTLKSVVMECEQCGSVRYASGQNAERLMEVAISEELSKAAFAAGRNL